MTPAIRVQRLGKRYELGRQIDPNRTAREALMESAAGVLQAGRRLLRGTPAPQREDAAFWALRDLSFEVAPGEAVGLIGSNGAGKSTLLKLLSRITAPTTGRIELLGRVGSLLEIGTGFHPDLSGRDNVYLNGAILGMRRAEITRRFDEIVAFAEVQRFIDVPVKRYSSGMYLRLAFAVAAHLEPEVLLVDEVLAVGDAAFQQKCLGKMGDVARQGRTVIFVSHSMAAVLRLCSRALLIERGRIAGDGASATVVAAYLARNASAAAPHAWIDLADAPRSGSLDGARFARVRYAVPDDAGGMPRPGGPLALELEIDAAEALSVDSLAVSLRSQLGALLVNADTADAGQRVSLVPGRNVVRVVIDAIYLNPGRYVVSLWLSRAAISKPIDYIEAALEIEVLDARSLGSARVAQQGLVPCRFTAITAR